MNKFIEIENIDGGVSFINITHIIRVKQLSESKCCLYLTDGTIIKPIQDYHEVTEVIRKIIE